jgi:hypothetical protein
LPTQAEPPDSKVSVHSSSSEEDENSALDPPPAPSRSPSQGRDARGRRRSRDHPRFDGVAWLRRTRQGLAPVAALSVARRGPDHESREGDAVFHLGATRKLLAELGVELLSAGLDEVPGVYKDIHAVMAAQTDLVGVLGRFDPKLVKMCPAGDRAED